MDVYAGRLSGLVDKLVCSYKLAADMIGSGVQEFVNYMDRAKFLKTKLVECDVNKYQ